MNLFNFSYIMDERNRIKEIEKLKFYPRKKKDELNEELKRGVVMSYYLNGRIM
ncbi:MAG: hypothetical protein GX336_02380 [Halanaerobiaceae bacterium]|nr:hypothetical protein [Halanaerobiaceae bacterium]